MDEPIRVLVVDDHFVVRKGVCALLLDVPGIAVVGEAADGHEAIRAARQLAPHVILMDLRLPGLDGIAATRVILAERPRTGILILTGSDIEEEVLAGIHAGALGYLGKASPREDLIEAVRRVAGGEIWLPPHLTARLLGHLKPGGRTEPQERLTEREREIVVSLARGWSNRRIADELHISEKTVRTHVSHVLEKLGVTNRVEAALHAVRSGIASLEDF